MLSPTRIDNAIRITGEGWTCRTILERLEETPGLWEDGAKTAGPVAAAVKHNRQVRRTELPSLRSELGSLIRTNWMFQALVRPRDVAIMFSRYHAGDYYGRHVDAALVDGLRRDVSFTIWLEEPESYQGGELVIDTGFEELSFKLPAGSMIVYPATSLHRVEPIGDGIRTVIVGWARSYVRDPAQRELLFELDLAKSKLFADSGNSDVVDLLSRCSANLQRMWLDD